jgi:hypothetical protein
MERRGDRSRRALCAWCGVAATADVEVSGALVAPFVVAVCARHAVWIRQLATPRGLRREQQAGA